MTSMASLVRGALLVGGLSLAAAVAAGCDDPQTQGSPTPSPTPTAAVQGTPTAAASLCEDARPVSCQEQLVADLGLVSGKVSAGAVSATSAGGVFTTQVDATAGGLPNSASNPFTYVRFEEDGPSRVDVDDLESLTSMDWHIGFKRYLVRLNSGSAGPSCVGATAVDGAFEDVAAVPDDAVFSQEAFYTEGCELIADDHGLGTADLALGAWWAYETCVETTGQVFLVQLDDGRVIKLVIDAYYAEGQAGCNDSGAPGSGGANFSLRWAFLP